MTFRSVERPLRRGSYRSSLSRSAELLAFDCGHAPDYVTTLQNSPLLRQNCPISLAWEVRDSRSRRICEAKSRGTYTRYLRSERSNHSTTSKRAHSVAGFLSSGHRAPTEFDCLRAVRRFARNLPWLIPFGFLSSCHIFRCSPDKQPVDIFRVFAYASRPLHSQS